MPARLYIRTSKNTPGAAAIQSQRLRAYCHNHGLEVAATYTDQGHSGATLIRPAWQRLVQELQPGDVVVAYRFDRLSRHVLDLKRIVTELRRCEAELAIIEPMPAALADILG